MPQRTLPEAHPISEPILYLEQESSDGRKHGKFLAYPPLAGTKPPRLEGEENVPETIRQYWQEAWIAVEIIPISAGVIVRLLLEKILLNKGYGRDEEYPTLGKLMKEAEEDSDSGMPESARKMLFPTIRDIAQIGNSAAHDPIPVGKAKDHRDSLTFIEEIIDFYYVRPAKMKRLKAVAESRKTQRQAGTDEQLSESDAVPRG